MRLGSQDIAGLLRSIGAVALGAGVILVLVHKGGGPGWTQFERFLVAAAPASLLFMLAVAPGGRAPAVDEPWRSVLLVISIFLSLLALFLFVEWIGADTKHLLYDAAVLVVTAAIAWSGGERARSPYAILLAALALLVAWLLVWIKILDHPSAGGDRWIVLAGGAVLLGASIRGARAGRLGARELAIVGGLGLVAAGALGVVVGAIEAIRSALAEGAGEGTRLGGLPHLSGEQTPGWDAYLVIAAVALIWLGAHTRTRGLGYVGATGLVLFVASTGTQLTRLEAGHSPSHSLWGWPLGLVIAGLVALAAPLIMRRRE